MRRPAVRSARRAGKAGKLGSPLTRMQNRRAGNTYRRALRAEMIASYGGACECCGEVIPQFLSLEHKNKDGGAHRRRVGDNGQAQLVDLKRQGWPREGYGLLCFNCNIGAGKGECPHVELRRQHGESG